MIHRGSTMASQKTERENTGVDDGIRTRDHKSHILVL